MANNQTNIEQLKKQGSAALSSGKFKEAIKYFSDCIEVDPNQPDVHVCFENRSAAYFSSGQHPQAFEDAVKAIQLCPTYTKSYSRAAVVLEQYNRIEEAKEFYARGLHYEPNNKELQKGYLACKTKEENLSHGKKSKRGGHGGHSHSHGGGHGHSHSHGHDSNCNHDEEEEEEEEHHDDHCGHDHSHGGHSHSHGGGHSHSHGPPAPPKYIAGSIDDKDDDTQSDATGANRLIVPNPTVPLPCEELDATISKSYAELTSHNTDNGNDDLFNEELKLHKMLEKQHYSSLDIGILDAYTKPQIAAEFRDINAYNALKQDSREERITTAQKALELCPSCAEAYNVLAVNSNNLNEALELYRKGSEVAIGMVPEGKFDEWISEKDIWTHPSMRSYHRCKQGIANCLRKVGKYEDALKEYLQLSSIDTVHSEMSSYVNFRYNIPDMYLSLKKYKELRKFLKDNEKGLKVPAASLVYIYSTCLLDFIESGDSSEIVVSQMIGANHKAVEYILGNKALPNAPDCSIVGGQFSVSNAVNFARSYRKHWVATEGALQWLATKWQLVAFNEASRALSMNNVKRFFQFVRKQPNIVTMHLSGKSLLHDASFQGHLDVAKYILEHGGEVNINKRTPKDAASLTSLHMASYNGHIDVVNLLLSKGADGTITDASGAYPIHMAANQGNWKVIEILLTANKNLLEVESKMGTPLACCFGSVELCLKGIEKCQRCQNSQVPHGPDCSPTKSVQILLERGANPNVIHNKQSLLHLAIECEMENSLELLLQKCDKTLLNVKDNRNRTPMQVATMKGNLKAITLLQKYSATPKPLCQNCGQPEADTQKLMVCSVCKETKYCSRECQKQHWKQHKLVCKKQ